LCYGHKIHRQFFFWGDAANHTISLEIELEKMVIHVKEKKAADTRFTRIV
jgi:hypothetical protein